MVAADHISVLLVEDSASEAQFVMDALAFSRRPRLAVRHVSRLADAVGEVTRFPVDVVVLDLGLPDAQELEGVMAIRAAAPATAIVVRSGLSDERVALEAIEAGAQDFIIKGPATDEDNLVRSIAYALARRQAEDSARRLAAIVDSSDDAIFARDPQGIVTSFNRGAERLFGYAAAEAIGRPAAMLLPGDRIAEDDDLLERVIAGERVEHVETQRRRKDGSIVDVSLALSPITDSTGTLIGAAAIARDITERKAAERRLAEAARFFELSGDLVCTAGFDGFFEQLNGRWEATLGWDATEMRSRPLLQLVHADDRQATADALATLVAGGSVTSLENRYAIKDGGWRWLQWSAVGVPDLGLIYASARDITDRVEAEAAYHEAEQRFAQAFDEAPAGMALIDLAGRFLLVNQALCDITGHGRQQLQATRVESVMDPAHLPTWQQAIAELQSGEISAHRTEARLIGAIGDAVPVDLSTTLLHGDNGEPRHLLIQAIDISERKRFEGQLQYLADHDPLTGMFNRRRFLHELQRELGRTARYEGGGALLAIDLDHFKYVNDSLGHPAGDDLITRTGTLLRRRLRDTDITARLGGDEFAVILPGVDEQQARVVAEGLLVVLREAGGPETSESSAIQRVTASIGVALFDSQPKQPSGARAAELTAEELLIEADIALYDAKEAGRDCIRVYDAAKDRHKRLEARLKWSERIRVAIEQERFVLHAQPIVALSGDNVPRHELLIRMLGDGDDLIPPGTFLYIAERFDMVQAIDRWVLRQTIDLLARHRRAGRQLYLHVNISAKSIIDPELLPFIAAELANAGIDGQGLCIEVTETAAIVNVDRAKHFASELRQLRAEFALDDFGAGFASFYYLKHMSFDYVKIDGEFIRDLASSKINQLIVKSVVDIARGIGKRTIAEYVGDAPTLGLLKRSNVDFGQGYHLGMPRPLTDVVLSHPAAMAASAGRASATAEQAG